MSFTGSTAPWQQEEGQESQIESNVNDINDLKSNVTSLQSQVDSLSTATAGGGYTLDQHLSTASDVKFHSVSVTDVDTITSGLNHLILSPNRGVSSEDFISISSTGTTSLKEVKETIDDMKDEFKTTKVKFDNNASIEGLGNLMSVVVPRFVTSGDLEVGGDIKTLQYTSVNSTLDSVHQEISVLQTDVLDIKNHHQPNQITSTGDCKFHTVSLFDPTSNSYFDLDTFIKQNASDITSLESKINGFNLSNGVLTVTGLFVDTVALTGFGTGGPFDLRNRIQYLMDNVVNNSNMVELKATRVHADQLYVKDSNDFEYDVNSEIQSIKTDANLTGAHHSVNNLFLQTVSKDDGSPLYLIEALNIDGIHLMWQKMNNIMNPVFTFDHSEQWYFSVKIEDYKNRFSEVYQFNQIISANTQVFLNDSTTTQPITLNQFEPVKVSLFLTSSSNSVFKSYNIEYFIGINTVTVKCEKLYNQNFV